MQIRTLKKKEVAQALGAFINSLSEEGLIDIGKGLSVVCLDEFGKVYLEHDRFENVVKRADPWRQRCFTVMLACGADGAGWLTPNGRLYAEGVLGPVGDYRYGVNPELDARAAALFREAFLGSAARAAQSGISEIRIMVSVRKTDIEAQNPDLYEAIGQA